MKILKVESQKSVSASAVDYKITLLGVTIKKRLWINEKVLNGKYPLWFRITRQVDEIFNKLI